MRLRSGLLVCVALTVLSGATRAQTEASVKPRNKPAITPIQAGSLAGGLYRNPSFGFTYKIPFGWVDRTPEMQGSDSDQAAPDPAKALLLLGIFERPPEATGKDLNSAVLIAAESVSSYPGLKTAADYFVPLEEVVTAKGFKIVNQPYQYPVGAKLLAREDFSKDTDKGKDKKEEKDKDDKAEGKLTIRQATLVMLAKGYVVSFTFIAASDDEVDELLAGLNFAATAKKSPAPSPAAKK